MPPVVALVESYTPEQIAALQEALPAQTQVTEPAPDGSHLAQAEVLITWRQDIDPAMLDQAPHLRQIVKLDSGTAEISAQAQTRGITLQVIESPGLVSVAEHAVMLILAVFKRLGPAFDLFRAQKWADGVTPALTTQESYAYNWVGLELFEAIQGKTIGLVGLGKIARAAAARLNGFEANVVYCKRNRLSSEQEQQLGISFLPFEELLAASHCVSLHNRFYPETEKMMGSREFALMRPGSFFVNTARGRLVDEEALGAALESGHLAGAGLDVFEYEPLPPDSPLLRQKNVILTPHSAGIPSAVSLAQELAKAGNFLSRAWES